VPEESVTAMLKTMDVAREWGTRELGLQDPNGYFLTFTEPA
jgi:hypothetical protein